MQVKTVALTRTYKGLEEHLAEMQRFFHNNRELRVPRGVMADVYRALLWALRNFALDDGHRSYVRGNLGSDAVASREPVEGFVEARIERPQVNVPRDETSARGGEVELALRSLLDFMRNGKIDDRSRAVAEFNRRLPAPTAQFDAHSFEAGWGG